MSQTPGVVVRTQDEWNWVRVSEYPKTYLSGGVIFQLRKHSFVFWLVIFAEQAHFKDSLVTSSLFLQRLITKEN